MKNTDPNSPTQFQHLARDSRFRYQGSRYLKSGVKTAIILGGEFRALRGRKPTLIPANATVEPENSQEV